jgi:metal-responsive CopG/Arc/MetJ family transcriptional regulator
MRKNRKTAVVSLSMPKELLTLLEQARRSIGLSRSEFMRQSIVQRLIEMKEGELHD